MKTERLIIKVWITALTFLAGFLNGSFLFLVEISVSHHTGNITKLVSSIVTGSSDFMFILLLPCSFFFGAFISGFIFHNRQLQLHRRYGIMVMTFAAVLVLMAYFKPHEQIAALIISGILGVQNGMFIFYNRTIVRTTHLTGYLTDAAVELSLILIKNKTDISRFLFYASSILCFAIGIFTAMFIPKNYVFYTAAALYFTTGLAYFLFRKHAKYR